MKPTQPAIIIELANPTTFDGRGSIIFVEYSDDQVAFRAAQKIAQEAGRSVKVTNTETGATEIIPAAQKH